MSYKEDFLRELDRARIAYTDMEKAVRLGFNSRVTGNSIVLLVFFEEGTRYASIRCLDIAAFSEETADRGLAVCNRMNSQYKWAKFCMDEEIYSVNVDAAAILDEHGGETLRELCALMVQSVEAAYPAIMKARWG